MRFQAIGPLGPDPKKVVGLSPQETAKALKAYLAYEGTSYEDYGEGPIAELVEELHQRYFTELDEDEWAFEVIW